MQVRTGLFFIRTDQIRLVLRSLRMEERAGALDGEDVATSCDVCRHTRRGTTMDMSPSLSRFARRWLLV